MALSLTDAQQRVARGAQLLDRIKPGWYREIVCTRTDAMLISAEDVHRAIRAQEQAELAQVKRRCATEALVMLTESYGVEMAERLLDAFELVGSTEMRRLLQNVKRTRDEHGFEPHRRG